MHGVGDVYPAVLSTFFEGHAPTRFIAAVEHALGRTGFDGDAEAARIEAAIDALESLSIAAPFAEAS